MIDTLLPKVFLLERTKGEGVLCRYLISSALKMAQIYFIPGNAKCCAENASPNLKQHSLSRCQKFLLNLEQKSKSHLF